jgi:SAM-dependent methyltransferase
MNNKEHWNRVYQTKKPEQLSWTQMVPQTSLDLIELFRLPANAPILDVGGGDSRLVDYLLDAGFTDITVLDISEEALQRARLRLGEKSKRIKWIVSDIAGFRPNGAYALWHDRATFHFMTTSFQVTQYLAAAGHAVAAGGYAVIGTFSENGPQKCSGLPVRQYSEEELRDALKGNFEKIRCVTEDHATPFHTHQEFLFCSFRRTAPEG